MDGHCGGYYPLSEEACSLTLVLTGCPDIETNSFTISGLCCVPMSFLEPSAAAGKKRIFPFHTRKGSPWLAGKHETHRPRSPAQPDLGYALMQFVINEIRDEPNLLCCRRNSKGSHAGLIPLVTRPSALPEALPLSTQYCVFVDSAPFPYPRFYFYGPPSLRCPCPSPQPRVLAHRAPYRRVFGPHLSILILPQAFCLCGKGLSGLNLLCRDQIRALRGKRGNLKIVPGGFQF